MGIPFRLCPADIDERPLSGEAPGAYVERLARAKARSVDLEPNEVVLAADTAVVVDARILGKPLDATTGRAMLQSLAGREHHVVTAVVVAGSGSSHHRVVTTAVRMSPMSDRQIDWYVGTGEPLDKAGAYAIQGLGGRFVERIGGSYSNVVGLPLAETTAMLRAVGFDLEPAADDHRLDA